MSIPDSPSQAAGVPIPILIRFPFCEHGSSSVTCPCHEKTGEFADLKSRYAKFNEPWTAEEAEELRQMAADGVTRADMAAQLGRSPNAIKMKLQSLGLYVPKPAAKPWTPEDEHTLVKLYRDGISFAELAAVFSRTEGAILRRLILLRAAILPDSALGEASGEVPIAE